MSSTVDIGTMIVRTEGTLGGRPRIDGTRIGVHAIAIEVARGVSPERLVSDEYWPYLSLAQVYAALAYYHAHKQEIDDSIAEEERLYWELANEAKRAGQGTSSAR
jgi:uncharacterized protein (DUF433 family)